MNKQEEIKAECDIMYRQIKDAENRLKELRSECKHQNTFEGNYSYRIGNIQKAVICSDRGELIKLLYDYDIKELK